MSGSEAERVNAVGTMPPEQVYCFIERAEFFNVECTVAVRRQSIYVNGLSNSFRCDPWPLCVRPLLMMFVMQCPHQYRQNKSII